MSANLAFEGAFGGDEGVDSFGAMAGTSSWPFRRSPALGVGVEAEYERTWPPRCRLANGGGEATFWCSIRSNFVYEFSTDTILRGVQ